MFCKNAKWLGCDKTLSAPIVIKKFSVRALENAVVDICGLGYCELFINGKRVGNEFFKPAVSDYSERDFSGFAYPLPDRTSHTVYYNTYDVTAYLQDGENTLAVLLGNGFYRQTKRCCEGNTWFGEELLLRYDLRIQENGKTRRVYSDGAEIAAESFITDNNLFYGETHDYGAFDFGLLQGKRCALSGEKTEKPRIRIVSSPKSKLLKQRCENDAVRRVIQPKIVKRTAESVIYDAGENVSGFVCLKAKSATVRVRHAEELDENGELDFFSAGDTYQISENTYKNAQGRTVHPWFSWSGFRYFEVFGEAEDVEVWFVCSGVKVTAEFTCDNQNIQWLFDGNGYKLINMRVSDGGIFGYAENATIKNLILTNVHLIDNVPAEISKQKGGYAGILAYTAPGSTFENIQITMASSPAGVWTYKRDGLFVVSSSNGGATYRDITVDASYIELKTLLGISHKDSNVYEDVLIKGASYVAIGYTADSYTKDENGTGVQNTAALMTEFPDGVKFETVAHAVIPNQPLDTGYAKLAAYDGNVTALGFAEGTNVFAITADDTGTWNNRILFPADSDNYDYVEFDVVLSADISSFTAWPSSGTNTQGSMTIYGAQMTTSDGVVRTVQVFDKDGNTFAAQYTGGFKANTLYTIRVCFAEGETLKYLHLGMGTAQTYYVSNARWGSFGTQNDVYTSGTGALLAKYDGDVTALGFAEGATVTQVTISDGWSSRVGINGSVKYDYVDVEFSFTGDRQVNSLCVWMYGTNAGILTGNYTVSATGCTAANGASERTLKILDADGNAVESLTANTVYTLRVYLNGDASTFAVSTFDTSAESTAILNFGDITYGNDA